MSINDDSMLPSVLGSAAAGIVSRACTHPLDTAKARLQAAPITTAGETVYKGPMDTLLRTFRVEGFQGLYRGFGAVIVGGTPGTMLYLCSYELFKRKLSSLYGGSEENFALHFTSGMLAETIACIIYVPVDVVKERMQVQHSTKGKGQYHDSLDAFQKIVQTEGLSGIYKGYAATLCSFGPFSALYFMFYERFKHWTRQHLLAKDDGEASIQSVEKMEIPFSYVVLSSCSAGALASWLTSPLDMAKLRLQIQRGKLASAAQGEQAHVTYRGVADCLRYAYHDGGVHGLFRGAWARVLHFAPATTITMTCYETFRSYFAKSLSR